MNVYKIPDKKFLDPISSIIFKASLVFFTG